MEEQEATWRQVKHLRLLGSHTFLLPFSEMSLIMYSFLIIVTTWETTNSGRSAGQLLVKGNAPWLYQNGEGLWGLTVITCPHLMCIGSISWLQRAGFCLLVGCYSLLNLNDFFSFSWFPGEKRIDVTPSIAAFGVLKLLRCLGLCLPHALSVKPVSDLRKNS